MHIKIARAAGGFLAIVTLLAMLMISLLKPEVTLDWNHILITVALISALLGVDILSKMDHD